LRRRPPIIAIIAVVLFVPAFFVWQRHCYDRYAASCQPLIKADERVLADISMNADDETIKSDLAALGALTRQWKPPAGLILRKDPPSSLDELRRCGSDLEGYADALAMRHMFEEKFGALGPQGLKDLTARDRDDMRAYPLSARDHLNRAKTLLSERK